MPKNIVHDVVAPKRSIRQVVLPREREEVKKESPSTRAEKSAPPREPRAPKKTTGGFRGKRILLVGIFVLAVVVIGFVVFAGGARVTVQPRQTTVAVDGTFTAQTDATPLALTYDVLELRREASESVPATGEERVEEKASGTITVLNNHSGEPQRFIKNTRFESPTGLIFRVPKSIVIPGKNDDGTPGSVTVTVVAESPGEEYNIDPATFTVPGLKDSELFNDFSARSNTAMVGGFSGIRKSVDPVTEEAARRRLGAGLEAEILALARSELPAGFVLFDDALLVESESLPTTADGENAVVREAVTVRGIIFSEEALGAHIARNTIADYEEGSVVVATNADELSFELIERDSVDVDTGSDVVFTLSGQPHLVWMFDSEQLRADLAGKSKQMINTVLSGYPSIERAEVALRPFWRTSFPDDASAITIEVSGGDDTATADESR